VIWDVEGEGDNMIEYMEEVACNRSNKQYASLNTAWSQLIYPITQASSILIATGPDLNDPLQIPRQTDSTSCGIFICAIADCIIANAELNCFQQRDIPQIRAAMLGILSSIYGNQCPAK